MKPKELWPKAKNPAHDNGISSVCAPIPLQGRRRKGRRMGPFGYKGNAVGMMGYQNAFKKGLEGMRKRGRDGWAKMHGPIIAF